MRLAVIILAFIEVARALQAVPVLVASHKVVPGLKKGLAPSNYVVHNTTSVTNMLKKLITTCSSDEYIIIDQPGLTYEDMTVKNNEHWSLVRKYLALASTVVGLPKVEPSVDLDFLERYTIRTCQAETINVDHDDENEVGEYRDTRTRVIRINLSPLPEDKDERIATIREHDDLIRKIIRKLPSPHYTLIMTSSVPASIHPLPESAHKSFPDDFEIFNDIVNDPSRENEVERNNNFHKVDPHWIENKHTNQRYLRNRQRDEIHFFNNPSWQKHEKMVSTIVVMIVTLFTMKTLKFVNGAKKSLINKKKNRQGPIIEKKRD